jgi:hypothetical protein
MFSFYTYNGIFRRMGFNIMPSFLVELRGREEIPDLGMAWAVAGDMQSWFRS